MHVHFKVHGAGKKNLHGDGIALWYTRDRLVPGRVVLAQVGPVHLWPRILHSAPLVRALLLLFEETWDLGATEGSVLLEDDPVAQLCAPLWPGVLHQLRMVLPFYHFILFYFILFI